MATLRDVLARRERVRLVFRLLCPWGASASGASRAKHLALVMVAAAATACVAPSGAGRPVGASSAAVRAADTLHVGFDTVTVRDGAGPPLEVGIWYPSQSLPQPQRLGGWTQLVAPEAVVAPGRHPLVVVSHGSGGWFGGHHDTALALADAGFVVAALTHPGDNNRDQSQVTDLAARPRALRRLVDYMIRTWRGRESVDSARVGAFGFSNGGHTVLIAIGGVPDLRRFPAHCVAHPANDDCSIVRASGPGLLQELAERFPPSVWNRDDRIRAAVIAAPALGFTFAPDGLHGVAVPVQLWSAGDDRVLPAPGYADAVRDALPTPPEYHLVPGAGHFDFLAPCAPGMADRLPTICVSAMGFDRAAFHAAFNQAMVRFFTGALFRP